MPPIGNRREHGADLGVRAAVERRERCVALLRQSEPALTAVAGGTPARDEPAAREPREHPAEISGVDAERAAEIAGGETLVMRQLVQHARFSERKGRMQEALVEDAEPARVEAGEAADGGDAVVRRHGAN